GYTRIADEEQAYSYAKADSKTDFLFDNLDDITDHNNAYSSDEESSDEYNDNYLIRSPSNQLNVTKNMLKEYEKFAYVAIVNLITLEMATELAKLNSSSFRTNKKLSKAQNFLGIWSNKILNILYQHLDLNEDEITMVQKLSSHRIEISDLSTCLKSVKEVDNPFNDNENGETQSLSNSEKILEPNDVQNQKTLQIDVAWTVICDLFLLLVSDGTYDSRSRSLLMKFGEILNIPWLEIHRFEKRITDALEIKDDEEENLNETEIMNYRAKMAKKKRMVYIGIATIGGGIVLGLSGGLLAPVIGAGLAAGLSTIGITGTSAFLAGGVGTALVTTASTGIGAKIGATGMMRRTGNVRTFEFRPLHNNKRFNLIVTISGWMNSNVDDVRLPFSTVDPVMGDLYSIFWEPDMLTSTGQTINILATEVLTQTIQQVLGSTLLVALMSAIQWPMILSKLGYIIDNPWNVSLDRAWSAGRILADTLISRNLGTRPITLVGFSLGARMIYSCLIELAKKGAYGIVENVYLFGSPFVSNKDQLRLSRSVVSGKFINGYSKKDWILGYLFRATSGGLRRVVGLSPIEDIEGIENFDCTEHVTGHMEYRNQMPHLLKLLEWSVISEEFIEIDEPDAEQGERQRKLILEFDEAARQMEADKTKDDNKKTWKKWFAPKRKDWWEIYTEGLKENERKK
ncbi:Mil1p, partial [Ascoidea rubescens DSM 1968]